MQAMDDLQEPTSDPRKAALGMLADGNSIASVADVFGLPPHVLEEWAREPRAPSPPASGEAIDATQTARQEHVAAPADDRRDRLHPLAGLAIAGTTLVFFLWSTVPIVVDSLHGTPPKDQLRRAAGWVRTWRDCYSLGRNTHYEQVTLVGDRSTVTVTIPCVLPAGSLSDGKVHRMTVLTGERRRLGTIVYDVELDGRTLVAYADEKQSMDDPWKGMVFAVPVLLMLLIAFAAAVWGYREDRRRQRARAGD